jgi:hypothetical protein
LLSRGLTARREGEMKPMNPFSLIMLLIVVVLLIAWLGGYLR